MFVRLAFDAVRIFDFLTCADDRRFTKRSVSFYVIIDS